MTFNIARASRRLKKLRSILQVTSFDIVRLSFKFPLLIEFFITYLCASSSVDEGSSIAACCMCHADLLQRKLMIQVRWRSSLSSKLLVVSQGCKKFQVFSSFRNFPFPRSQTSSHSFFTHNYSLIVITFSDSSVFAQRSELLSHNSLNERMSHWKS